MSTSTVYELPSGRSYKLLDRVSFGGIPFLRLESIDSKKLPRRLVLSVEQATKILKISPSGSANKIKRKNRKSRVSR